MLVSFLFSITLILINSFSLQEFDAFGMGSLVGFFFAESTGYIASIVFIFFMAAVFKIGIGMQEENKSFV
jgi:hypothetical protein